VHFSKFPQDLKKKYQIAFEQLRENRPKYFDWLKGEIDSVIDQINEFNKVFILGGLGARLLKSSPTLYHELIENNEQIKEDNITQPDIIEFDDEIELLLEYAMSIATASENNKKKKLPTQNDIDEIYDQLSKIKFNVNFFEITADNPNEGDEYDHWLRTLIMSDTLNVRGTGYQHHIQEIYYELFEPHNEIFDNNYGFNAIDVFEVICKLDSLVYSKVGNPMGGYLSHQRFKSWLEKTGEEEIEAVMKKTGKHFIRQFTEDNPDLYDEEAPSKVMLYDLDNVAGYDKVFWVIPETEKERLIFDHLSIEFGDNRVFFEPEKFKAFPLNDTEMVHHPLIKENDKYYNFSANLAFRNAFQIIEHLLLKADKNYYQHTYRGNTNINSKDNYVERKVMNLFKSMMPECEFYHSLKYAYTVDDEKRNTELDILGISNGSVYIIEVKSGELNIKHRRGAMKGLKDRINETINEGSYQCHRALEYILESDKPIFEYNQGNKTETLNIDKSNVSNYFKITVTLEHFSTLSANLKYLINIGILSPEYKWAWIVSLHDLMIFSELIENETDFIEYLTNRIALYERDDVEFSDEIDILGFFLKGHFPLGKEKKDQTINVVNFKNDIDKYFNQISLGILDVEKPKKSNQ